MWHGLNHINTQSKTVAGGQKILPSLRQEKNQSIFFAHLKIIPQKLKILQLPSNQFFGKICLQLKEFVHSTSGSFRDPDNPTFVLQL